MPSLLTQATERRGCTDQHQTQRAAAQTGWTTAVSREAGRQPRSSRPEIELERLADNANSMGLRQHPDRTTRILAGIPGAGRAGCFPGLGLRGRRRHSFHALPAQPPLEDQQRWHLHEICGFMGLQARSCCASGPPMGDHHGRSRRAATAGSSLYSRRARVHLQRPGDPTSNLPSQRRSAG